MTIRDTINDTVTIVGGERTMLANRYRIVRQLGQGGMGSVWLVEDTELDNKQFAIKMLPSILVSNKRAYRQLKDEALVAMKLTHPNIVTLRAFEEDNGNPFLVMDYVEGQTLDDYLAEKGKLSEEETVKILRPIAAALDYAHTKGVVHRDIKPANVMIATDGTIYILDFGIAREMQETLTRVTGKLSSGTLLYMSPEQLRGMSPKPSQDVYSFSAMAYECLKGTPPFYRGAIEDQIKNEPPEPLTGCACTASVMAGLAKRPEDRPVTCAAVLGVGAIPKSAPRKSFAGMLVALLAIVAVLGGGVWYHVQQQEKLREQARIFAEQKAEAEHIAEKARLAEEKRLEEERLRQEEERLIAEVAERAAREEAERKAEEGRIAKAEAERIAEESRIAEEQRIAEERRLEEEKERLKAEAAEREAKAEAERKAEEERIAEENRWEEEAKRRQEETRACTNCLAKLAMLRREALIANEKVKFLENDTDGFEDTFRLIEHAWSNIVENTDVSEAHDIKTLKDRQSGATEELTKLKGLVDAVLLQLPQRDAAREKREQVVLLKNEVEAQILGDNEKSIFANRLSIASEHIVLADEALKMGKFKDATEAYCLAELNFRESLNDIKRQLCDLHVISYIEEAEGVTKRLISPDSFVASIGDSGFTRQRNENLGVDELVLRTFCSDGAIFTLKIMYRLNDGVAYEAIIPIQRIAGTRTIEVGLR